MEGGCECIRNGVNEQEKHEAIMGSIGAFSPLHLPTPYVKHVKYIYIHKHIHFYSFCTNHIKFIKQQDHVFFGLVKKMKG